MALVRPPAHLESRTASWNYAIRATRGEWTMMLHADDRLVPEGLSALLAACRAESSRATVMIAGRPRDFDDEGGAGPDRPRWPFPAVVSGAALRERVLPFLSPFVPFTVFRRATFDAIGGFDTSLELVQDGEGWIRMLALGDLYYFPVTYGLRRTHGYSPARSRLMRQEQRTVAKVTMRLQLARLAGTGRALLRMLRVVR
jgi:hypothetical protein